MSTRANIQIINNNNQALWLYKHHDGYVTHTGNLLEFAWTSWEDKTKSIEYLVENGVEVTTQEHSDIEYLYTIENIGHKKINLTIYNYTWEKSKRTKKTLFNLSGKESIVWTKYKLFELSEELKQIDYQAEYYKKRLRELEGAEKPIIFKHSTDIIQ